MLPILIAVIAGVLLAQFIEGLVKIAAAAALVACLIWCGAHYVQINWHGIARAAADQVDAPALRHHAVRL